MKKISALLMLFISITILINAQESSEKKVIIYLVSVEIVDTNGVDSQHLIMFDTNKDIAIDNLTTLFEKEKGQKGTIWWESKGGIKKIIEIKSKADTSIIFDDGIREEVKDIKYRLKLPINRPFPGEEIKESYLIKYIPTDSKDTLIIDPYIDLKPPSR